MERSHSKKRRYTVRIGSPAFFALGAMIAGGVYGFMVLFLTVAGC